MVVTTPFITPYLDEAAYLPDRTLVTCTNPGRTVEFIESPAPRPRGA